MPRLITSAEAGDKLRTQHAFTYAEVAEVARALGVAPPDQRSLTTLSTAGEPTYARVDVSNALRSAARTRVGEPLSTR